MRRQLGKRGCVSERRKCVLARMSRAGGRVGAHDEGSNGRESVDWRQLLACCCCREGRWKGTACRARERWCGRGLFAMWVHIGRVGRCAEQLEEKTVRATMACESECEGGKETRSKEGTRKVEREGGQRRAPRRRGRKAEIEKASSPFLSLPVCRPHRPSSSASCGSLCWRSLSRCRS